VENNQMNFSARLL